MSESRTPWLTAEELAAQASRKGMTKVARTRKGVPALPDPRRYRWDGTPVASTVSATERISHGQLWSRREKSWYGVAMDRDYADQRRRTHKPRSQLIVAKSY